MGYVFVGSRRYVPRKLRGAGVEFGLAALRVKWI